MRRTLSTSSLGEATITRGRVVGDPLACIEGRLRGRRPSLPVESLTLWITSCPRRPLKSHEKGRAIQCNAANKQSTVSFAAFRPSHREVRVYQRTLLRITVLTPSSGVCDTPTARPFRPRSAFGRCNGRPGRAAPGKCPCGPRAPVGRAAVRARAGLGAEGPPLRPASTPARNRRSNSPAHRRRGRRAAGCGSRCRLDSLDGAAAACPAAPRPPPQHC